MAVAPTFLLAGVLLAGPFQFPPPPPPPPRPAPPQHSGEALRVFLDCQFYCDFDYLRTEIAVVNYVRDRKDAQVHILVTTQITGSGGREYTLRFIGLQRFAGVEQTLRYVSAQTATQEDQRQLLGRALEQPPVPQRLRFCKPDDRRLEDRPVGQRPLF